MKDIQNKLTSRILKSSKIISDGNRLSKADHIVITEETIKNVCEVNNCTTDEAIKILVEMCNPDKK